MPEDQEQAPPLPDYSDDGVDLSLVRWMLSLAPAERLRFAEDYCNELLALLELNGLPDSAAEAYGLTVLLSWRRSNAGETPTLHGPQGASRVPAAG